MNELLVKCCFICFISLHFWSQLACEDWNFKSSVLPPAEEKEAWSCNAETRTGLCCRVRPQHPALVLFPTSAVPINSLKWPGKGFGSLRDFQLAFSNSSQRTAARVWCYCQRTTQPLYYVGRHKLIHPFRWSSQDLRKQSIPSTSRAWWPSLRQEWWDQT